MKKLIFALLLALVLWSIMFMPVTAPYVNFWWMMTASAAILSTLSFIFRPELLKYLRFSAKDIALGVVMAAALWGVFWVGDKLSTLLFGFARQQVNLIYGMKAGESPLLLSALMILLIGPAEEIFWRGYVQHSLSKRLSPNMGYVVATLLYALVHVGSCNFMLIMAAAVAGAFWGLFYRLFPDRMVPLIVSHALWDAAVFIWFPI